jgi:anaerobic ribonucleoside-triphosphate reductase activating protein
MNYGNIKKTDVSNGEGVRVSLFVSGCRNHCKGCFNQETWNFSFGKPFTPETETELLQALAPDYIAGLSVLGGEPFEEENQRVLLPFLRKVRETYPEKTIWCYTGYVYDKDLQKDGRKHCEATDEMLALIDVLVDGPFIEEQRDISLQFRGSRNQRILRLK